MSGHNPHSRVSQPVNSSSWNHLQVPSYMPRQPQLAHMSSERTLRSSPLIWPNTNPADAFYNYMALTAAAAVANSNPKNTTLDINPLLPFVRTPSNAMPFNSVDLSLSTANANRNSLTPSPRNPVSPGAGPTNNRFTKPTPDATDDNTNNGANKMDSSKLNTDQMAFFNEMSDQIASMRKSNRNSTAASVLPHDATNDLSNFRINGGNDKPKQRNEPMELVREPTTSNPFENESLSNSVHLQQLLGLTPPVTSSITPNLNDLSKSLLSIFNNASSTSPLLVSPKSSSSFSSRQTDTSKNCLNTINDDSLDSQSGTCNGDDAPGKQQNTRYRRRKPQKTVRMPNEMGATDSIAAIMDNDKNALAKNDCHKTDANNSNGFNFPPFHSEVTNLLPPTDTMIQPPQTQSIDLSHHCANQEMFENGLANYSKANDLDAPVPAGERSDKDNNLLPPDEMNGLNLFGAVNFGHLRGTNLTNDIVTFPNTDDLVKKVEELVKCNEQNGFGNTDFAPMELTKPQTNKLAPVAHDGNRIGNGVCETIKITNNIEHEHTNNVKCNGNGHGNGMPSAMASGLNEIENNSRENVNDKLPNIMPPTGSNSMQICEMKDDNPDTYSDKSHFTHKELAQNNEKNSLPAFAVMSTADNMYDPLTNERNNQSMMDSSLASAQANDTANTLTDSTTVNDNEVAKAIVSASSSESNANASPTPKKKPVTKKKKTNNRLNGKTSNKNNAKNNQKNAKPNDNSDKKSDIKKTKSKDDSTAEAFNRFRGPYVHVARDGTLDVINAPVNEEIAEKQSKFKKSYISQRLSDRNKVRGLHVSTLSNKYDAVTTDISWMCVFCKLGPHKYGLGDLFGPFILSTESEDFQLAQIDPKEDLFKSHRNKRNIPYASNISAIAAKSLSKSGHAGNVAVKRKRKLNQFDNGTTSNLCAHVENNAQNNDIDIFYGMTQASDSSYEVWAHEDCLVWASGVHIIGARVVGLEAAVWGSVRHQCSDCKQYGAMLSCLQRSCNNETHVPCAKRCDWDLDESSFQSRCSEHAQRHDGDDDNNQANQEQPQ